MRTDRLPRLALLAVLALPLSLGACKGKNADPKGNEKIESGGSGSGGDGGDRGEDGGTKHLPLTAAMILPVIREVGPEGVVPGKIVVEFSSNVVLPGQINRSGGKTDLKITPPVEGAAVWTGPSTLTFTPAQPFAFDTRYTVSDACFF